MDFVLPHELAMIRDTVASFVRRHLQPLERRIEQDDGLDAELWRDLRRQAVALGLFGYNMPSELGGPGLGALAQAVINEELGKTSIALGRALGHLPGSLIFANADQREWLVAPLMRGETTITYALTEPDAGSDLGRLRTRGRKVAGGWMLEGRKQFISDAENADHVLVLVVTHPEEPLKGRFTTFVVERANPGLRDMTRFAKMGWRGSSLNAFALVECHVSERNMLGAPGEGFIAMMTGINNDRLRVASKCVGLAQRAHDLALTYASERTTFGAKLCEHQAIQMMVADSETELEAARLLTHKAAALADARDPAFRIAASRAKLYASEMAGRVADRALQIFGGAGYVGDWPIERIYRDARAFRLGEGTSEMQRIQIARHAISSFTRR